MKNRGRADRRPSGRAQKGRSLSVVSPSDAETAAKRACIEAVLARARPLFEADGLRIEILDVGAWGASIEVVGVAPGLAANFEAELEQVLREEIEGFGELNLVVR